MASFTTIMNPHPLTLSSHRFSHRRRLSPSLTITAPTSRRQRRSVAVVAAQTNFLKVIQTTWRVGKDVIETGSNLVPETIPRPIARIGVAGVAGTVALFLLKSLLSTAFFVLAMMGAIYFIYVANNKDEGPPGGGGGGGTPTEDESLAEARRIMEKYK